MTTAKAASTEIVRVPFYGDTLQALKTPDDKVYVHFKSVCENLGVAYSAQLQKLRAYRWPTVSMIDMVAEDGKQRRLAMIPLRVLPGWLMTVHPAKVAFEVRDKLERYQMEAFDVLADHFLGAEKKELAEARAENERLKFCFDLVVAKMREQEAAKQQLIEENRALANPLGTPSGVFRKLRDFAERYGVFNEDGKPVRPSQLPGLGRALAAYSRALDVPVEVTGQHNRVPVNAYRLDILHRWKEEREARFRATATRLRLAETDEDGNLVQKEFFA